MVKVCPGDQITNNFTLNQNDMTWMNSYIVTPKVPDQTADIWVTTDNFVFNQSTYATDSTYLDAVSGNVLIS
jgi:hypothetical protein